MLGLLESYLTNLFYQKLFPHLNTIDVQEKVQTAQRRQHVMQKLGCRALALLFFFLFKNTLRITNDAPYCVNMSAACICTYPAAYRSAEKNKLSQAHTLTCTAAANAPENLLTHLSHPVMFQRF